MVMEQFTNTLPETPIQGEEALHQPDLQVLEEQYHPKLLESSQQVEY